MIRLSKEVFQNPSLAGLAKQDLSAFLCWHEFSSQLRTSTTNLSQASDTSFSEVKIEIYFSRMAII